MSNGTAGRRPTANDVARMAGVSAATVSFVLNGVTTQKISGVTRDRVFAAAESLGYRPSGAGRALRLGRSNLVLFLVPALPMNESHSRFFNHLSGQLRRAGLVLVVHHYDPAAQSVLDIWDVVTPACVLTFGSLAEDDVAVMRQAGSHVLITFSSNPAPGVHEISRGDESIGFAQAEYLASTGVRAVGFAVTSAMAGQPVTAGREAAIEATARGKGLEWLGRLVLPVDSDAARTMLRRWWDHRRSRVGVAAWNDEAGAMLLTVARSEHIDVPAALAVIGAYDQPVARWTAPMLTTVWVDIEARAEQIGNAVIGQVRGEEWADVPIDGRSLAVAVRQSC